MKGNGKGLEVFKTMVAHPIASWIVVSTVFTGLANVVSSVRGNYIQPGTTTITTTSTDIPNEV